MPKTSPFDITNYCSTYKYIYPYNIAEVLCIKYEVAEQYFCKYKKKHPDKHNYIKSIDFFNWYFKGEILD